MSDCNWIGQSVSWLIVITGWIVINHQNNQRETRKELRAAIDSVAKQIIDTEISAIQFHKKEYSDSLAQELRIAIDRIDSRIELISKATKDAYTLRRAIITFRQAITLYNFDRSNHQPEGDQSGIINDIAEASNTLIQELEQCFIISFR
jgi:hypothetical protein